jgi:sulfur-oxidizing protein SoxA
MKMKTLAAALVLGTSPAAVLADEDADLIINGEKLKVRADAPDHMEMIDTIRSGWTFRSAETQALQMDNFDNPGMIFVDEGRALWNTAEGGADKSCASCHGDMAEGMKGVRASMPKMNPEGTDLWTLEENVNNCRTERMDAEPWKWESPQMLAMTAAIGAQSRGMPVDVEIDGPAREWWEKGKELYYERVGQLDMACANCHEDNYGNMIRADHLSQGQINGFPVYRLKWGGLGSIHRRFKGCMKNIRAEPFNRGSDEFKALELYVASRGEGLDVETPSVRN